MARVEGRVEGEEKGLQKGRVEGVLIGRVMNLQELLGVAQSTIDELSASSEVQLNELAEQLQRELRNRIQ